MNHELTLKRPDGSKIKIVVRFWADSARSNFIYNVDVRICEKNKRTWVDVVDTNDYEYRKQSFPVGRDAWAMNKMLEFVTKDEIQQAKIELWEKLKPTTP